ncbi:unnamed protein product, partial [Scytosiphon promiscuus]
CLHTATTDKQASEDTRMMPERAGNQDCESSTTVRTGAADDAWRSRGELASGGSSPGANGKATAGPPFHRRSRPSTSESTATKKGTGGGDGGGVQKQMLPLAKSPSSEVQWTSVAADRLPTPTEQTPSPRSNMSSVGARGFAFGFTQPAWHNGGGRSSSADGDRDRYHRSFEGNGEGGAGSGGGGGEGSGQGRGSCSPEPAWLSTERGSGNNGEEA